MKRFLGNNFSNLKSLGGLRKEYLTTFQNINQKYCFRNDFSTFLIPFSNTHEIAMNLGNTPDSAIYFKSQSL